MMKLGFRIPTLEIAHIYPSYAVGNHKVIVIPPKYFSSGPTMFISPRTYRWSWKRLVSTVYYDLALVSGLRVEETMEKKILYRDCAPPLSDIPGSVHMLFANGMDLSRGVSGNSLLFSYTTPSVVVKRTTKSVATTEGIVVRPTNRSHLGDRTPG